MSILSRLLDSRTMWLADQSTLVPMVHKAIDGTDQEQDQPRPDCEPPLYTIEDGVAIISIRGVIVRECTDFEAMAFGLCSSSQISEAIEAADSDPAVAGILLDIDSPGGECCGTPDCADVVASCRKPVASWSGGLMASAAYWIGSHAKYVTAGRSANVGSIGVICTTYDLSAYYAKIGVKPEVFTDSPLKGSGNPDKPMTDEQRAYIQASVDQIGIDFRSAITSRMPAKAESMQGQCFIGPAAVAAGLLHEITTRDGAVAGLRLLTPAAPNTDTMTIPEQLAEAQSKFAAIETEAASLRADIAAKDASLAQLTSDHSAAVAEIAELEAKAAADLGAISAQLETEKAKVGALEIAHSAAERKAVEMMAQVGQSPVVPAIEKKASTASAAPKPLTGLARAIAAIKSKS